KRRAAARAVGRGLREQPAGVGSAGAADARPGDRRPAVRAAEGAEADPSRPADLTGWAGYGILSERSHRRKPAAVPPRSSKPERPSQPHPLQVFWWRRIFGLTG